MTDTRNANVDQPLRSLSQNGTRIMNSTKNLTPALPNERSIRSKLGTVKQLAAGDAIWARVHADEQARTSATVRMRTAPARRRCRARCTGTTVRSVPGL
jgi:hypothetical protein